MNNRIPLPLVLALTAPFVAAPAFAQTPPPAPPAAPEPPAAPAPLAPKADAPADHPAPPVAVHPPPPHHPQPWIMAEISTLHLLHAKGVLSQAEYDSAVRDLVDTSGMRTENDTTFVVGKFAATIYGFAELDAIWDSTQSFNDVTGNTQVQPSSTYAGSHARTQFGVRNSRFGVRVKSPETRWFRASGVLEMDFEGATLPIGAGQPYYGTEAAYFNNPTFRLRHGYVKFETPVVDFLFGQTWHLFGWQGIAFPATVDIQGIPAELYTRTAQARMSHTFKTELVEVELAVAAMRPPQRNSGVPEGTGGIRLAFPKWSGMQTVGSTGTHITPLTLGVSGTVREIGVPDWKEQADQITGGAMTATPKTQHRARGGGVAVDLFVPVIPATRDHKGNSLSLTGELVYGQGLGDLYTSLSGGVPLAPSLPNPNKLSPAPTYVTDIDPGIASFAFDSTGKMSLNPVQWTTFNLGAQYYFPGLDGRLFVSGYYARAMSGNSKDLLGVGASATAADKTKAQSKIRDHEEWFDFNIFGDPYPGVRLGLEYAHFNDTYLDGTRAVNHRVQFSGFYIF